MDIIRTEDRAVATEILNDKNNNLEGSKKSVLTKIERKKSENKKLKKKLNEIEEQNETLTKLMNDKNSEILELKTSVNALNEILNSVPINELRCNASIASAKLLELSKKNRQLRAELERTKNRLDRKEQEMLKLAKDFQAEQEKLEKNPENSKNSNVKEMQRKLSALQQKLFETRNKNVELNVQFKLAQKCVQQEIGESFNLNLLANPANSHGWRGRAQQIIHLQQKIKELQERLDGNKQNELCDSNALGFVNPSLYSSASFGSIDQRPHVRKTEIQHRHRVESLEKEIHTLRSELEDNRAKILALKVRNKTLNDEISRYKQKTNSLEEQKDFNNFNVAAISERLSQQKSFYENRIDELIKDMEKILKEKQDIKLNREHLEAKIQELQNLILQKDNVIDELNLLVKKLEQDLKATCGDFLFACREFRKEEFIAILDSLESEKNSLLDVNKTLNERLTQERFKNDSLTEQATKQKTRISRLEARLRELEHEVEIQMEKKKRSQRIAEYTANLNTKCSLASISSFTFENSTTQPITAINKPTELILDEDPNDLKNRLELTTEKITILKEKLDYLSAERENDLKTFHEILKNSKNILVEMISTHRQHSATASKDV